MNICLSSDIIADVNYVTAGKVTPIHSICSSKCVLGALQIQLVLIYIYSDANCLTTRLVVVRFQVLRVAM
jgi:hypothetical protein